MLKRIKNIFLSVSGSKENGNPETGITEPDPDVPASDQGVPILTYSKIPLTLALRKRQFDEQQRKKYGIPKEKQSEFS